jgi:1-deoxy-D-xylulose-5-phosphate synthase
MALLDRIGSPADVRALPSAQLDTLCNELRSEIVRACAPAGGHLGGSLGAVELTVALHRAFETPRDLVVFDTGHQAYAHKILTGRREVMARIRQDGGPAGFLERAESPYDTFGAGHASTGLSAALGLAEAAHRLGERRAVIAVVGDGALTGGLAFEALNNACSLGRRVILLLNDNGMSIAPNVGAIERMLRPSEPTGPTQNVLRTAERLLHVLRSDERAAWADSLVRPGPRAFFESLSWNYLGPIDGHDISELEATLARAKAFDGPVVVHARTEKGRGFALAEADVLTRGHAMGPFDAQNQPLKKSSVPSYTEVFADALTQLMEADERVVAITAAMPDGTGLARVSARFPDRVYDVGIAEAHAVTFAAGLAAGGLRPVCALYSTFLQRAYDQVIHDVCLQNLPVTFALDRAGLVGGDGATHQGAFDVAYLRTVPNLTLMAPSDENELRHALATALTRTGPCALRFPRGAGPGAKLDPLPQPVPVGQARVFLRTGVKSDVAIVALGPALQAAVLAARELAEGGIKSTVVDARFVKPLDQNLLLELARGGPMLTVEQGALAGGFGSAVLELLEANDVRTSVRRLGLPDRFMVHGDAGAQYKALGLDASGIARAARELCADVSSADDRPSRAEPG